MNFDNFLIMNFNKFYAKSNPKISISQHNKDLLKCFNEIKQFLNKEKLDKFYTIIEKLIEYHDLGKTNQKFQDKILGIKKHLDEVPHEWLSIAFIDEKMKLFLKKFNDGEIRYYTLFCYCIANHHSRNKSFQYDVIEKTINEDLIKKFPNIEFNKGYNIVKDFNDKIDNNFDIYFEDLIFLKGVLHKCDYAASAGIMPENSYIGCYMADFKRGLRNKGITKLRKFQDHANQLSDKSVILVASTGIGKTEYAMNWINGSKSFYLLGLRIAVNAMHERFKFFFKEENVTLLHSDLRYYLANEKDSEEDYYYKMSKARQFSYPITVATADQLVTSVFKFNSFEMHYLTASYSKIVVDEIQSFSPESIACIIVFLQEIAHLGGKFLLMTATLPPFIKQELEEISYIEPPQYLPIKRHKIKIIDTLIEEYELNNIEIKAKKILIICNTVKKVQLIYEKIKELNPKILHSNFINLHKKEKEIAIQNETNGIWITTQIVEASLDIDFDFLLTECSTIDSILQRFGRCFRKREYNQNKPNVLIFKYDEMSKKIYDPELLDRSFKVLKEYDNTLLSEEDKHCMIEKVFTNIEETKYYKKYKEYKELLKSGYRAPNKSKAQELFRMITNSYNIIPEPLFIEYKDIIIPLIEQIDSSNGIERIKLIENFYNYCTSIQIFGHKKLSLLKDFPITSNFLSKENIKLLCGVNYSYEKGVEFIKDFIDNYNFIF